MSHDILCGVQLGPRRALTQECAEHLCLNRTEQITNADIQEVCLSSSNRISSPSSSIAILAQEQCSRASRNGCKYFASSRQNKSWHVSSICWFVRSDARIVHLMCFPNLDQCCLRRWCTAVLWLRSDGAEMVQYRRKWFRRWHTRSLLL